MPREPYPRGLIHSLVNEGGNPTATLRMFREAGGRMRTQTWYRMWGEVTNERALGGIEEGAPLNQVPGRTETLTMTTRRAKGYMQRVQVVGRDISGNAITKTIDIRTPELMTRSDAIGKATDIVEGIESATGRQTGSLPVAVLGAFYGGTYLLRTE